MPPMPIAGLHDDGSLSTEIVQPPPIAAAQADQPRPGRIDGEALTSVGSPLPPGDADRPFGADVSTSLEPQLSVAPAAHPVHRAGNGGDEEDRFAAPIQDAGPASAPATMTEARSSNPPAMPTGSSPRDLVMAHIERRKAAAEAAALDAPIVIEAVIPNISMERLTASTPQRAAAGDRAIDKAPGSPVGVGTAPQPTIGDTILPAMTIHPRVATAADRSDVTLPLVVQAIGGAEGDVPTSARPPVIPVPPPRTSAPPVPPARNVEPPASKARLHEAVAPSPSDRSVPMSVSGLADRRDRNRPHGHRRHGGHRRCACRDQRLGGPEGAGRASDRCVDSAGFLPKPRAGKQRSRGRSRRNRRLASRCAPSPSPVLPHRPAIPEATDRPRSLHPCAPNLPRRRPHPARGYPRGSRLGGGPSLGFSLPIW